MTAVILLQCCVTCPPSSPEEVNAAVEALATFSAVSSVALLIIV